MSGFNRQEAAEMLRLGWTQDQIKDLHAYVALNFFKPKQIGSWGVLFGGTARDFIAYRGHTVERQMLRWRRCVDAKVDAVAYTDGSGTTINKAAGIGVALYQEGRDPKLIAENIGLGTNNRAELTAIWRALRALPCTFRNILVYSDSEYAIGSLTKSWNAQVNGALIAAIREDIAWRNGAVVFKHVDGHAGNEGNEVADYLSKAGRKWVKQVSVYET